MWDGFNKRKFPRLHLTCEVVVYPQGRERAIKTITENVGMGGLCLMLDEPLERFDRCKVTLELKDGGPRAIRARSGLSLTVSSNLGKTFRYRIDFLILMIPANDYAPFINPRNVILWRRFSFDIVSDWTCKVDNAVNQAKRLRPGSFKGIE